MKYFIYTIATIVSFVLFLPKSGTTQIRNIPVLIALMCAIAAILAFKLVLQILFFSKVKKAISERKYKIVKTKCFRNITAEVGTYDKKTINIAVYMLKKRYARYHFDSPNLIEFYKTVTVVSKRSNAGSVSRFSETRRIGRQRIKWIDGENISEKILVMNKIPNDVTDCVSRQRLSNTDTVCSDFRICDLEGFVKIISE